MSAGKGVEREALHSAPLKIAWCPSGQWLPVLVCLKLPKVRHSKAVRGSTLKGSSAERPPSKLNDPRRSGLSEGMI